MNNLEINLAGFGIILVIIILCSIQCISIYKCCSQRKYDDFESI